VPGSVGEYPFETGSAKYFSKGKCCTPMANKASEVHVELAEVDGKQVTTTITN
jgi:hypothetical protein